MNNEKLVSNDKIIYENLLQKFPWIIESNHKAIISPDCDGIISGLFMSEYLNWEVAGYYDGKILALRDGINPTECVFLDMEIFRKQLKSCGHHMVLYSINNIPKNWKNFDNSINPNIIRKHDVLHNYKIKYPFGNIHFLICIINNKINIEISDSSLNILMFVDGVFKNLFNYPENCISWLKFLGVKNKKSPMHSLLNIFSKQEIAHVIHGLVELFGKLNECGVKNGRFNISKIVRDSFQKEDIKNYISFLKLLSELTNWKYNHKHWNFKNLKIYNFTKMIEPGMNNDKFKKLISRNPLSFAFTGRGKSIEYTLEKPDKIKFIY